MLLEPIFREVVLSLSGHWVLSLVACLYMRFVQSSPTSEVGEEEKEHVHEGAVKES